ncbi:MAG TPA: DsbA family protein [Chitinophaga sp.]
MTFIYISDPICGWCYGFTPVVQALQLQHPEMTFQVLSGGMVTGDHRYPIERMEQYILKAHKQVEAMTGITFGKAFLEGLLLSRTYLLDSEKPGTAITVFKQLEPARAVDFVHDIQVAFHYHGKSLNDDATYRELVAPYGLDANAFVAEMNSDATRYATHQEFAQVQSWGITGFPAAVLATDKQYYLVARGFTPQEDLEARIRNILKEEAATP